MNGRVWLDVSALQRSPPQATGIPRVLRCLARALIALPDFGARLCVIDERRGLCETTPTALFDRPAPISPTPRLTVRLRERITRRWRPPGPATQIPGLGPDDLVVSLGGGWTADLGGRLYRQLRRETGVRIALMLYDLIPIRLPEFFPPLAAEVFPPWLRAMTELADVGLAISRCTRDDFVDYCARQGLPCPPTEVIRLGEDFAVAGVGPHELLPDRSFVLSVGTIEVRKNHRLLYDVWRQLLTTHDPERVPLLVLAGSRGWLTDDLYERIAADPLVRAHIRLLHTVDDATLATLYERCLFTVYPSRYEGWGLPVCESLGRGKICLASSSGSIPEIDAPSTDLLDPDDVAGWVRQVERYAFDDATRREREGEIRHHYRPTRWCDTAASVAAILANRAVRS